MILEVIRYLVPADRQSDFEEAYARAANILSRSPFCLKYTLTRSKKETARYLLLIEWESAEAHLEGFRRSADFREFFQLVKPFYNLLEEMEHYETIMTSENSAV